MLILRCTDFILEYVKIIFLMKFRILEIYYSLLF